MGFQKLCLTVVAGGVAIALAPETLVVGTVGGIILAGAGLVGGFLGRGDSDEDN